MKRILLTSLIASTTVIFMGCSDSIKTIEDKDISVTIEDSSIEDDFKYPDNSTIKEFGEISDGNFEINIDGEKNISNKESDSYNLKTIDFDGISIDIPSNWEKIDYNGTTLYVFENNSCTVNFVSEHMQGLSPDKYMQEASISVNKMLNVDMIFTETDNINGVRVDTFEYVQSENGTTVYTYQPTIFKDGTAYILTLASVDKSLFDSYKDLACDVISKAR